jgi:hypothetical protein
VTYKLTVDQPHLGDEGTVYIHGLGTFQNGKTYSIGDDLAQNFETINVVDEGGIDGDPESPTFGSYIPKVSPGKSLDVAAETMYGITVVKDADDPPPLQPNTAVATNNDPPADTGTDTNGGDS